MTAIRWTFVTVPRGDGREVVHLHVSQPERIVRDGWWTESPRRGRMANEEAVRLFDAIMNGNGAAEARDDEERLFKADEPIPKDANVICWFDLLVDSDGKRPIYRMGTFERREFESRYNPVWDCLVEIRSQVRRELAKRRKENRK